MGNLWRKLGTTYIYYSNVAAHTLRQSLKPAEKQAAMVRDRSSVTFTKWLNGRPVPKEKPPKKQ